MSKAHEDDGEHRAVTTPARYGNLVAAFVTLGACDVALGLTFQLIPLLLEKQGWSARTIGLNGAMGPLGILLLGPFMPRLMARFGARRMALVALAMTFLCIAGLALTHSLWAWFVLRLAMGMAVGGLFTVSESWIMVFAGDARRGQIMGLYTSMLALTFAIGPLLMPFTGIEGFMPWAIALVFVGASILPLACVQVADTASEAHGSGGMVALIIRMPLLLACICAVTMSDGVLLTFFSLYGLAEGLPFEQVSWLLSAAILGNVITQPLIGFLADRFFSPLTVLAGLCLAAILAAILVPVGLGSWLAWPVMLLLGTSIFGPYTIVLSLIGKNFRGADLVLASAIVALVWGVGGLIGPPLAGFAIDWFGIGAFPWFFAALFTVLLGGILLSRGNLVRKA